MAGEDTERYKNEMQTYNGRQEAKMRSEALKPPVNYPVGPPSDGRNAQIYAQGAPGPGPEAARAGGYPEQMAQMSAFANPAMGAGGYNPYGGMDFSGYGGMGGYGMGAYGGGYSAQDAMAMQRSMEGAGGAYGGGVPAGYGAAMGMMGGGFQGGMMGYG